MSCSAFRGAQRHLSIRLLVSCILLFGGLAEQAHGIGILKLFRFEPPPAGFYGSYQGETGILLGEVRDETFGPTTGWIGLVDLEDPRSDTIRSSVEHFLDDTGLSMAPAGDYRLDVTIRRYRLAEQAVAAKDIRQRAEVFLELELVEEGRVLASVLACGNAESRFTKFSAKKRFLSHGAAHAAAVDDALVKWTRSRVFRDRFGQDWKEGPLERRFKNDVRPGRIDRSVPYGPTPPVLDLVTRLEPSFDDGSVSRIAIEDFAYLEEDYLEELEDDPEDIDEEDREEAALASRWIPDLLVETLRAYYPQHALEIVRGRPTEDTDLVINGNLYQFDLGGSKQAVNLDLSLIRGGSEKTLHTLYVYWISGSASGAWSPIAGIFEASADARNLRDRSGVDSATETYWVGAYPQQQFGGLGAMTDEITHNLARALVNLSQSEEATGDGWPEIVFEGLPRLE